jgi:hypothetical protein
MSTTLVYNYNVYYCGLIVVISDELVANEFLDLKSLNPFSKDSMLVVDYFLIEIYLNFLYFSKLDILSTVDTAFDIALLISSIPVSI